MKLRLFTAIAITAMAMASCSEDTETIGSSITNESDKMVFSTGVYQATSRSIMADSVYSKTFDCYFGKVKDPETNSYVKNEFMAQFNMLEGFSLPDKSTILGESAGDIAADSCEIWLIFDRSKCYGDSLTPLKVKVKELAVPVEDGSYYSNFDPVVEGYVRKDGINKSSSFALSNLHFSDSLRSTSGYAEFASISLNDPYTDKDGNTYNNFGTYLMRQYYSNPEKFKNAYTFIHTLVPGFNFEVSDGLGVMANISQIDLVSQFRYKEEDSTYTASIYLSSTPEVLQTSHIENDKAALNRLVADNSCTYLKSPAGIFTEVTLPVDDISLAHANDSLLSVSVTFERENSGVQNTKYPIGTPQNILMVQKDSLYSFFENKTMYDYTTSFMATLSSNAYTFSNIGNLITQMARQKAEGLKSDAAWEAKHPDWNKVVLVPVATTSKTSYDSYGYSTTVISDVHNQLGLSSTKLVGGANSPIEVKVIYAKFKQ